MAALSFQQEITKLANKPVGPTFCIFELFTNRAPDFSLHTALMKPVKKTVDVASTEFQAMVIECAALAKYRMGKFSVQRSEFDILAGAGTDRLSQVM